MIIIDVIMHNDEDFVSSEIECEAYDNIDELKGAQEYHSDKNNVIILR